MQVLRPRKNHLLQSAPVVTSPSHRTEMPSAFKTSNAQTSVLLQEFQLLINTLSTLDEPSFRSVSAQANEVADQLLEWFKETIPTEAFSIYWTLRHLRQSVKKLKSQTVVQTKTWVQ